MCFGNRKIRGFEVKLRAQFVYSWFIMLINSNFIIFNILAPDLWIVLMIIELSFEDFILRNGLVSFIIKFVFC